MREQTSERGAALVVSLMLLLAMGFVGAALISMSAADLKVAGDLSLRVPVDFLQHEGPATLNGQVPYGVAEQCKLLFRRHAGVCCVQLRIGPH